MFKKLSSADKRLVQLPWTQLEGGSFLDMNDQESSLQLHKASKGVNLGNISSLATIKYILFSTLENNLARLGKK